MLAQCRGFGLHIPHHHRQRFVKYSNPISVSEINFKLLQFYDEDSQDFNPVYQPFPRMITWLENAMLNDPFQPLQDSRWCVKPCTHPLPRTVAPDLTSYVHVVMSLPQTDLARRSNSPALFFAFDTFAGITFNSTAFGSPLTKSPTPVLLPQLHALPLISSIVSIYVFCDNIPAATDRYEILTAYSDIFA